MPWIPISEGISYRPLRVAPDGWTQLMRLQPGAVVGLHRHTGEVHAYNLSGTREILGTGEHVGPGDYVYEPAGNIDAWQAVGDQPCVIYVDVNGAVEYLDSAGAVTAVVDAGERRASFLRWARTAADVPAVSGIAPLPVRRQP